ncbi:YkvS family protein [Halobacillus litoralis]|uniref:YkvS family protein n=1 Tax=Halobacillus litoralis TaxID=45668 RepID=UPI001CD1C68C|nr:YkvS family protein [Halobacillus litoralis]MCA0970645.1 YkvS family protein [Halobacillus litoralis]
MADENISKGLVDAAFKKKQQEEEEEEKKAQEGEKAGEGDIITFERDGQTLEAIVTSTNPANSVVCDLTIMEDFHERNLEHEMTVVAHKNYKVKKRSEK